MIGNVENLCFRREALIIKADEAIVWCPKCKVEYNAWAKTCSDCLEDLVSELPEKDYSAVPLKLLVSLADESEAETIISLLAVNNIQVVRE